MPTESDTREDIEKNAILIAQQYNISPDLMLAMIEAESGFNPNAKSPAGASGLMQLMPATASRYNVTDVYDPIANMTGGAQYLRFLLDTFKDETLAIAGYNAGEGNIQKYGNKIPPFRETQNYVTTVKKNRQKYYIKPPTDMWGLPVDVKQSSAAIDTAQVFNKPYNPSMPSSTRSELEALLHRTGQFLDSDLASRNGDYFAKNTYDQYWDDLAIKGGFGPAGLKLREEVGKLMVGLAHSMGGDFLEPKYWYEHGLIGEYVENMPQIFAIKRQELESGEPARKNSLLEQLKYDLMAKTPQEMNFSSYGELGQQAIFEEMQRTAKAYGRVLGQDTDKRLYANSDFLNSIGFGGLALLPENRMKLQETQRHLAEQIEQEYKGANLPEVLEGGDGTGTFSPSSLGGQPAVVPKDAFKNAAIWALMGSAQNLWATEMQRIVYASPLIKDNDRQTFTRDVIFETIERIGMTPAQDEKKLNESLEKINALSSPDFWTKLVSPEYYNVSLNELQRKAESARTSLLNYEKERQKLQATSQMLVAIHEGNVDAFTVQVATMGRLGIPYDDIGDKYVIGLAGSEEGVKELLTNFANFKTVVGNLSRLNLRSSIVSQFIQGLMPAGESKLNDIGKNIPTAYDYYSLLPGDKGLFVNKHVGNLLRMYEEVKDGNFDLSVFANVYSKIYNNDVDQNQIITELSSRRLDSDDTPLFETFLKDFFQSEATFGIEQVEVGTQSGQKPSESMPINLDRRDLQKVFEIWNDTNILYRWAGVPNPAAAANKAVKETLGVFYNDQRDFVPDVPSVVPILYSTGEAEKRLNDYVIAVENELKKKYPQYQGFFASDPQVRIVWDFSGTGQEFDVYEVFPDDSTRYIERGNAAELIQTPREDIKLLIEERHKRKALEMSLDQYVY